MSVHLDRAGLLLQQGRYPLAEQEARAQLVAHPEDPFSHAFLALCLYYQDNVSEATTEAEQAIHFGPDMPFSHYVMAKILLHRNRYADAEERIEEAIRLDPHDPDHFSLLSGIHFEQYRWDQSLDAARSGLAIDPDHAGCKNLEAMALVKLGRGEEAGVALEGALAKDPENALSQANQGWALLHAARHEEALGHFREALRLNPDLEWARLGIVEALKARNILYGLMLRYFLWMSRLSPRTQWFVIIGAWFGYRALRDAAKSQPELAPIVLPVTILYGAFVVLTWTADPLFNLLLRCNRFGRLALSEEQTVASNWLGASLALALASVALWAITSSPAALSAGLVFGLLSLPISATFRCHVGWPRNTMAGYTGLLGLVGAGFVIADMGNASQESASGFGSALGGIFLLGSALSLLLGNFLLHKEPTK
ncbi:MAG: tetratricopeptide repeat protein [Nitrospira sp.]|nr:tetratricopeptide repeat protein [Nitrospira sp.]